MSLILDALKRAERERQAERSAALEDLPAASAQRARPRRRWRRLGVVALLAIIAALGWSFVRQRPVKPPVPESAVRPARPAPSAPQQSAPPAASRQPATPPPILARPAPAPPPAVIPGTEGVVSLEELTSDQVDPALAVAPQTPAPATPEAPAPADEPEEMPVDEPEEIPAEEAPAPTKPAPAPAPAEPVPRAIPPALTQPAQWRRLREMPPDYRADFPALTIEVHVYERAPAQRFVLVNGRRYKEGERLAEGPQLLEIVREGIVLDYRGERVLYPIGR
jgi:general secretion pathway protein B